MASRVRFRKRMDIARPEFKVQKRRRQTVLAAAVILPLAAVLLSPLEFASEARGADGGARNRVDRHGQTRSDAAPSAGVRDTGTEPGSGPSDSGGNRSHGVRGRQWARTQAYLRQGEEDGRRTRARFNDSLT